MKLTGRDTKSKWHCLLKVKASGEWWNILVERRENQQIGLHVRKWYLSIANSILAIQQQKCTAG